jgi:hypothetical protein
LSHTTLTAYLGNFLYLQNYPVLLFMAILPLAWMAAGLSQAEVVRRYFSPAVPLTALAVTILSIVVLVHLLFAVLYLLLPKFAGHIGPTVAINAWIYSQGGQLYHALDAPERYSFLYGPVPYISTAWLYDLIGPSTFSAKLAGFTCLPLSLGLLALSVRQRFRGQLITYSVALGCFSLLALFFIYTSFKNRPDPFMIAAAALGLYSCLLRPGRTTWLLCGIALGIAVNAKVTGAIYFIPYLAWFFDRDGYRVPLYILLVAAAIALLPFLSVEQVSLRNYIAWLEAAGKHGISSELILKNLALILFAAAPIGLFVLWQWRSVGVRSWLVQYKLVSATSIAAALLIVVAGAKAGSGPYHFLPFFPALAFLTAYAVSHVYNYRPTTAWSVYGFWAPMAALLVAAIIKAIVIFTFFGGMVFAEANESAIADELAAVMAAHPQQNIYMGYGDDHRRGSYASTFVRTELAFAGHPYLLDAAALMDFKGSGIEIPAATIDRILVDESAIWLIPVGDQPFALLNWYRRDTREMLFDENFRLMFLKNFMKTESGQYFDLYARKPRGKVN